LKLQKKKAKSMSPTVRILESVKDDFHFRGMRKRVSVKVMFPLKERMFHLGPNTLRPNLRNHIFYLSVFSKARHIHLTRKSAAFDERRLS
jgi:hypothetical protein